MTQSRLSHNDDVTFANDPELLRRAGLHAALGEPIRLAIVDELMRSDRAPVELATQFALPTNLLSHHLAVLERVGLIERSVSSGDRRRRYVCIVPDAVVAVGAVAAGASAARLGSTVFVCTHNSARSQLAAALWTHRTGAGASSAGTHPAPRVHPGAVAAGRRRGVDLSAAVPRSLTEGELGRADLVVTVCDRAHEEVDLPVTAVHWSIPDPVGSSRATDGSAADDPFDAAAASIERRIAMFVPPGPAAADVSRRIHP